MRFFLILAILLPSVTMILHTIDFTYFAYTQQQQLKQSSTENNINASKTLNSTNTDTNFTKSNTNKDLAEYLGYHYEYNFY